MIAFIFSKDLRCNVPKSSSADVFLPYVLPRDPHVEQFDLVVFCYHYVRRFDVKMDNVLLMKVRNCFQELLKHDLC